MCQSSSPPDYGQLRSSSISASLSSYSHYVFATLDHDDTGVITFEVKVGPSLPQKSRTKGHSRPYYLACNGVFPGQTELHLIRRNPVQAKHGSWAILFYSDLEYKMENKYLLPLYRLYRWGSRRIQQQNTIKFTCRKQSQSPWLLLSYPFSGFPT